MTKPITELDCDTLGLTGDACEEAIMPSELYSNLAGTPYLVASIAAVQVGW